MAFIWTVLLLALLEISFCYKLPSGEFKAKDSYNKGSLTVEDPSTINSTARQLFQWLPRNVTIELDRNLFKGSRVRREVTEADEDYSLLEEMTTASEENQTTEAFTSKTSVIHDNPTTEPKHQTDMQSTQAELNDKTSHIFVTPSTMQDLRSTKGLDISEVVTNAASTPSLATSQTTNLTQHYSTQPNTTSNLSTGLVDPGFRLTATALPVLSTTPSKPSVTNEENSLPEKQNFMNSLLAQCLLAISILAFIAMVFIICTIVLATKLSKLRNRYKLLTKNSTEMVCISALLPEHDQPAGKTKVKASKLKTFAATVDDGEGDNLTLNSFLPEH